MSIPAQTTVQRPLPLAGAMGITKYFLPWLSLRGIGVVEGLMISSLSFSQIAFLVIRHPLLFDQNLLGGFFHLSRLFLASPIAGVILGGLVIGYLVTGVVLPGKELPERWNIRQTLVSTGIAVGAGLVSVVPICLGILRPNLLGYGLVAVGFFLGPWLRARLHLVLNRSWVPSHEASSSLPNRREIIRSLVVGIPSLAVTAFNAFSTISVKDNWRFFVAEKTHVAKFGFPQVPTNDPSVKVADLSTGLIGYQELNPQGENVVLVFHGFYQSHYGFPPELETIMKQLNIRGIFLDRPGVGISTLRPGLDLAAWPALVEELVQKILNNQDVSIIGHSAGGLYALACAKLACVRALALVCCPTPMTVGSFLRNLYREGLQDDPSGGLGVIFMPHTLIPGAQETCQGILYDWEAIIKFMLNYFGPGDEAFLTQNENAIRQSMATFALQDPLVQLQDAQTFCSPWPLTPADTARVSILIYNGVRDRWIPPSVGQELQTHFAPNARLVPPLDMGHFPTLKDWERIFAELGKLHIQEENLP